MPRVVPFCQDLFAPFHTFLSPDRRHAQASVDLEPHDLGLPSESRRRVAHEEFVAP